jgi:hypothetical protein
MEAAFFSGAPEGHSRPGPWPLPGTVSPKNGRVPGIWGCSRCGRSAEDTSRAKDLATQPRCGAAWVATPAAHALVLDVAHWRRSRCLLAVRPQHPAQSERQLCLVAEFARAGARWPQGEAGLREVFGTLRALRHFCCPADVVAELPEAAAGAASEHVQAACAESSQLKRRRAEVDLAVVSPASVALRLYFSHVAVKVGRCAWCLNCFEVPGRPYQAWEQGTCGGTTPTFAMPLSLRDGIVRMPDRPELPPAVQERCRSFVAACRR